MANKKNKTKQTKKADWRDMATKVDGFKIETNHEQKEKASNYYAKKYKVERVEATAKKRPKALAILAGILVTVGILNMFLCPAAYGAGAYSGAFIMLCVFATTILSIVICSIAYMIIAAKHMPNYQEDRRYNRAIGIQSAISLVAALLVLTIGIYQKLDVFLPYLAVFAAMLTVLVIGRKNRQYYNLGALFATYVTSTICIFMALFPIFARFSIISNLQNPWLCFGLTVSPIVLAIHLRLKLEQVERTKVMTVLAVALCVVAIIGVVANSLLKDNCRKLPDKEKVECWYCLNL